MQYKSNNIIHFLYSHKPNLFGFFLYTECLFYKNQWLLSTLFIYLPHNPHYVVTIQLRLLVEKNVRFRMIKSMTGRKDFIT